MKSRGRLAVALVALAAALGACSPGGPVGRPGNPELVVLGFDGVDPRLVRRAIAAGRLPNLTRLIEKGALRDLETTTPPQSPVAWATFATGLRPGSHGVFGLLERDPETYGAYEGAISLEPPTLVAGLPLRGPAARSRRHGESFWAIADRHGVTGAVLRVPYDFPPERLAHGRVLSGVGVPDLRGTTGRFTFFTTAAASEGTEPAGGSIVRVAWRGDRIESEVGGLRVATRLGAAVPLRLERASGQVAVELGAARAQLAPGQWSDWLPIAFPLSPFFSPAGLVRFYLVSLEPDLALYMSPASYDPRDPFLAISAPGELSASLARSLGLFQTLGWAEPTSGLDAGALDEVGFLAAVADEMRFSRALLLHEIDQRRAALVVAVFTAVDRIAHMFHRFGDPASPLFDEAEARRYGEVIDRAYDAMDLIVGDVLRHVPESTRLVFLSDHGFHGFDRAVNLNTWLEREGLMRRGEAGGEGLAGVEWEATRAYALGIGELYLNLRGREAHGVVAPGAEAEAVLERVTRGLLALRDPETDAPVVRRVDRGTEVFRGPFVARAPDLQISFAPGYRSSFATALGTSPPGVIEPNLRRWSGDHSASSAEETPGILVTSFPLAAERAALLDVAPTVLTLLGVPVPEALEGEVLR